MAATLATGTSELWRVGGGDASGLNGLPTSAATAAVAPLWLIGLWVAGAYRRGLFTADGELLRKVLRTAGRFTLLIAATALIVDSTTLTRHLTAAVALAVVFTLVLRPPARRLADRSVRTRRAGRMTGPRRILLVGRAAQIAEFNALLGPADEPRLDVVAACVLGPLDGLTVPDLAVPVSGAVEDEVVETALAVGSDAVVVAPCAELTGQLMRRICWRLHEAGVDVALAPMLADVAVGRIAVTPAGGMPLLHLRAPVLSGPARWVFNAFERTAAALLLACLSPLMITLAVLVRSTSKGPALFRQQRVGLWGESSPASSSAPWSPTPSSARRRSRT